jgi:DnaJ-class molecular chaperone
MHWLHVRYRLRNNLAKDSSESDDEDCPDDETRKPYLPRRVSPFRLRLRCYACNGSGKLWVRDQVFPSGREAPCVVCRGSGRVPLKEG